MILVNCRLSIDGEVSQMVDSHLWYTILVQEHDGSSFEGIGFFEGTGTFNGTGRFVGAGNFQEKW